MSPVIICAPCSYQQAVLHRVDLQRCNYRSSFSAVKPLELDGDGVGMKCIGQWQGILMKLEIVPCKTIGTLS